MLLTLFYRWSRKTRAYRLRGAHALLAPVSAAISRGRIPRCTVTVVDPLHPSCALASRVNSVVSAAYQISVEISHVR